MADTQPNLTPQPGGEKKKAPPEPKSFLFINKDPESEVLSRSSGRVATCINSHVQRWQEKKGGRSKAQLKTQGPQQSRTAPAYRDLITKFRPKPRKRLGRDVSKLQTQLERKHSDSRSSGHITAYSKTPDSLEGASENDGVVKMIRHNAHRPPLDIIYRANFSGPDCIDPFQSTYAHYPGVQPILQYYISFTLVSTFQSDSKAKNAKEPPHFPAIRSIVRGSLAEQMHMYALLAATAARMKRVSGIRLPRESSTEFLLHNAIRCIREYFASCTGPLSADDRQVILDIFYLCVCEWYEKRYAVARTHLGFVRHFWNLLRPSESIFDKYIHDMITYNDVFLAIETASPPLFELTWEPQSLPVELIHEIEEENRNLSISLSQSPSPASKTSPPALSAITSSHYSTSSSPISPIASGFVALATAVNNQLPIELIAILGDNIPLLQTAQHHHHTLEPPPFQEVQWVSLKTQALLHKLLSLHISHHTAAECIRLALIILLSCISTSAAWRSGKVDMGLQARRLRSALSFPPWQDARYPIVVEKIHCPVRSSSPSPSLLGVGEGDTTLFWILATGAFAAQNALAEEEWFLDQAAEIARRWGMFEAARLKNVLQRYLFLESLEDVIFERLCTAVGTKMSGKIP